MPSLLGVTRVRSPATDRRCGWFTVKKEVPPAPTRGASSTTGSAPKTVSGSSPPQTAHSCRRSPARSSPTLVGQGPRYAPITLRCARAIPQTYDGLKSAIQVRSSPSRRKHQANPVTALNLSKLELNAEAFAPLTNGNSSAECFTSL